MTEERTVGKHRASKGARIALALVAVVLAAGAVVISNAQRSPAHSVSDVRQAFERLPYRILFREPPNRSGVLEGRAWTLRNAPLKWVVGVGSASLPPIAESKSWDAVGGSAFVFSDNSIELLRHTSTREWHELAAMSVDMQESLCKLFTGGVCAP